MSRESHQIFGGNQKIILQNLKKTCKIKRMKKSGGHSWLKKK
ncbi:hypothetical protein [Streptococcus uberis]|nr:hypothetical protein [Streptococcus uberis]KKF42409.1 hypothetical protein AF63_05020 [Streptococcus uberis Ab71]KKF54489.1 hypothetical protein AF66_07675 [Streptococcus uberis B190]